ncbi:MAG: hypothetical protein OXD01_03160 [Gammaproteobacteria bacterium]|nr:hypothetical protein [Gammaproteobacteria bacterium]
MHEDRQAGGRLYQYLRRSMKPNRKVGANTLDVATFRAMLTADRPKIVEEKSSLGD